MFGGNTVPPLTCPLPLPLVTLSPLLSHPLLVTLLLSVAAPSSAGCRIHADAFGSKRQTSVRLLEAEAAATVGPGAFQGLGAFHHVTLGVADLDHTLSLWRDVSLP